MPLSLSLSLQAKVWPRTMATWTSQRLRRWTRCSSTFRRRRTRCSPSLPPAQRRGPRQGRNASNLHARPSAVAVAVAVAQAQLHLGQFFEAEVVNRILIQVSLKKSTVDPPIFDHFFLSLTTLFGPFFAIKIGKCKFLHFFDFVRFFEIEKN